MAVTENVKLYIDYLDKEMTIMGILSAFCVTAAAFPVNAIFGNDKQNFYHDLAQCITSFVLLGGAILMLAALFFYRERSLLAYYYGQICLRVATDETGNLKRLAEGADSWDSWKTYQRALGFVVAGFVEYGVGLLTCLVPALKSWYIYHWSHRGLMHVPAFAVVTASYFLVGYVLRKYEKEEDPYSKFWASWS